MAEKSSKPKTKRATGPKGPALTWNSDRDVALVSAVRSGDATSAPALAEYLADNEAFSDVPSGAISSIKIRNRLTALRKKGVDLGNLSRGRYTPDVDALNAIQ